MFNDKRIDDLQEQINTLRYVIDSLYQQINLSKLENKKSAYLNMYKRVTEYPPLTNEESIKLILKHLGIKIVKKQMADELYEIVKTDK